MEIENIRHEMPKKIIKTFDAIDRLAGMVKEVSIDSDDYKAIADACNKFAARTGARHDGVIFYRGILLKKFSGV